MQQLTVHTLHKLKEKDSEARSDVSVLLMGEMAPCRGERDAEGLDHPDLSIAPVSRDQHQVSHR